MRGSAICPTETRKESPIKPLKFIVDQNVGKLVKWLRMMGYDTIFFTGANDSEMVAVAIAQDRVLITRDTHIIERRVVTTGKVKVILLHTDDPTVQIRQVIRELKMDASFKNFSLCLECNQPLVERPKEEVRDRVPPYVFKTQAQYMECPSCHRIYWKGTHWQRMTEKLATFSSIPDS